MKVKQIEDVPKKKGFSGLLLLKAKEYFYTPDSLLDKIGCEKTERPVFTIRPFNYIERHEVESVDEMIKAEGFSWCKVNKINPSELDSFQLLALKAFLNSKRLSEKTDKVLRSCVLKINSTPITDELFERLHPSLCDALFTEVKRISYLTEDEELGL